MRSILERFVAMNGYHQISPSDLNLQHLTHPSYSSIRSITDTLDYFGVECLAAEVPKNSLDKLPNCILIFFNETYPDSYGLLSRRRGGYRVQIEGASDLVLSNVELCKIWSGKILAIEPSNERVRLSINGRWSLFLISGLLIGALVAFDSSFYSLTHSVLCISGIYFSYLIVNQEFGVFNRVGAAVCGSTGDHMSCSQVVKSTSGILFSDFSMSDLCVVYFVGSILISLFLGLNTSFQLAIEYAGVPVILYSFYQQGIVLKQWCILCVVVSVVFLLQFIVCLISQSNFVLPEWNYLARAILLFSTLFMGWRIIKKQLLNGLRLEEAKRDLLKFKRAPDLFRSMLSRRRVDSMEALNRNVLVFGSQDSSLSIDVITNPFCGYCVESFSVYDRLLKSGYAKVKLKVLFNVSVENINHQPTQIALRILELYRDKGEQYTWQALSEWFANRNIDRWFERYGLCNGIHQDILQLQEYKTWCQNNRLMYTPITILNGGIYPQEYHISDLPILVESLANETGV